MSFVGAATLSGCGAGGLFPESTAITAVGSDAVGGSIRGSDFGGHAPLVGAHIYLLQPGQTGYGSLTKGLLKAAYKAGSSYPTTQNVNDQFVPAVDSAGNAYYYETADSNGVFDLTGDYSCTVGQPVYIVGYGGAPSFVGPGPNVFPVATEETYNNGSTGVYLTYTTTSPQLFYVGEPVVVSGSVGATGFNQLGPILGSGFHSNGTAAPLSTTSFTIFVPYNATLTAATANIAQGSYGGTNVIVTGTPVFNPAAVNLAMLGVCPASGNFSTGATALQFVYMNEISTTAMAYAMNAYANFSASFTATATNGSTTLTGVVTPQNYTGGLNIGQPISGLGLPAGATITAFTATTVTVSSAPVNAVSPTTGVFNTPVNDQSGNNEFFIGAPSTTQAQQGIQNAAINAGNLYDIQHAAVSTTGDGEGHLARALTASGAGVVPQSLLDTVGNTLAACVDSQNNYRSGTGVQSPQCLKLDQYAQDNGYYDTTAPTHLAFNIAQAAFNIAKYPQGMGTATTPCGCYGGAQVYTAGTAATALNFTTALTNLPTGNVPFAPYLASPPNDFAVAINWQTSPYAQGGTQTGSTTNLTSVGELAIDTLGNAFIANNVFNGGNDILELNPSGYYTTLAGRNFVAVGTTPVAGIAIDPSNNIFVSSTVAVQELTAASSYTGGGLIGYVNGFVWQINVTSNAAQIAIDNNSSLYIANLYQPNPATSSVGSTTSQLVKEPAVIGNTTATFSIVGGGAANTASSCASYMSNLTLDASGNIWTTNQNVYLSPDATVCRFDNNGNLQYSYILTPGSTVGLPNQIAIDAFGNAWTADKGSNNLIKIAAGATNTAPTNGTATKYTPGVLNQPLGVAVDGNNTIWVTNSGNASISQLSNTGALLSPTYYTSTTNSVPGGGTPTNRYAVVDQSGNLWSVDTGHGQILEYIGVAAPTVQPLATARATGKLGAKP